MAPKGAPVSVADAAGQHLLFMKYITSLNLVDLRQLIKDLHDRPITRRAMYFGFDHHDSYFIETFVSGEVFLDKSRKKNMRIHRIHCQFKHHHDIDYATVGWVVKDTATSCMRCFQKFKHADDVKYHCKCCGDVCCLRCSSNRQRIVELPGPFTYRVCKSCYAPDHPSRHIQNRSRYILNRHKSFVTSGHLEDGQKSEMSDIAPLMEEAEQSDGVDGGKPKVKGNFFQKLFAGILCGC